MRARAAIVLNFVPTSDDGSDDRWGDALVTSLARDVVALTEELERLAGVSGSPDETLRRIETIRENVSHIARGCRASTAHNPAPYLNSIEAALVALAGVGEHRPASCEGCGDPATGTYPDEDGEAHGLCDACVGEHRPDQPQKTLGGAQERRAPDGDTKGRPEGRPL